MYTLRYDIETFGILKTYKRITVPFAHEPLAKLISYHPRAFYVVQKNLIFFPFINLIHYSFIIKITMLLVSQWSFRHGLVFGSHPQSL